MTSTNIRIIRTKYLGPTYTKNGRIVATDLRTGERLIAGFDHTSHEPYEVVSDRLITKLNAAAPEPCHNIKHLGTNEDSRTHERFHVYQF